MDIIEINADNIDSSHICCAIGATPDARMCADAKKGWMGEAFADGYHFWRADAQGKALIEAVPAENAWLPIRADGWMALGCFWVSGKFKGQGLANNLLQKATEYAKEMGCKGLAALSADKKHPFLSDPGYLRHKGFVTADTAKPFFELLALPFAAGEALPVFNQSVKTPPKMNDGITIYFSKQCPHTVKYMPVLQQTAEKYGVKFTAIEYKTKQEAQNAPCPATIWAMYDGGTFVTNEIYSEGKLVKYLENMS